MFFELFPLLDFRHTALHELAFAGAAVSLLTLREAPVKVVLSTLARPSGLSQRQALRSDFAGAAVSLLTPRKPRRRWLLLLEGPLLLSSRIGRGGAVFTGLDGTGECLAPWHVASW